MSDSHRLTLAGIGCGSRTRTYLKLAMERPDRYAITALADPVSERTAAVLQSVPEGEREDILVFPDAESLLSHGKLADVAVIGTQDELHFEPCRKALQDGYDVLLEKPIAKTLRESLYLRDLAAELGRRVLICHVLRYTPFYRTIRQVIQSGELGRIMTFNANEGVEPWHFAHSFVRGHWGNSKTSTPMIVAKCCHDMDILYWLMGRKCRSVASFGELSFFKKESLDAPRPERCVDWTTPIGEDPWDARKYAMDESCKRWLRMVYDRADDASQEEIFEWLRTSPWGRDELQCDNDQPDHQVAIMQFDGGMTGTFTMTAFEQGRHLEIYGTKARLRAGVFYKDNGPGEITVTPHFGGETKVIPVEEPSEGYAGHGGGDWGLVDALYDDMRHVANPDEMTSSIAQSAHSHVMAFAIEHARRTGTVVDLGQFERQVIDGELDW